MSNCQEWWCNNTNDHIHLSREDVDAYEHMSRQGHMAGQAAEIERTRNVETHNYHDLLDHMKSFNSGHAIDYAEYRSGHEGYDDHIPGVRPKREDYVAEGYNDKLSHQELIAAHEHDHRKWGNELPHTTVNGEHFHH